MSKLTEEQFEAYLKQIRELVEGPLEEMQPEIEVTNKFPQEFYDLAIKNDLYRFALPSQYGGWDLSELDILRVQEEFSRGPGGMRMHLHYAADLNWRILDDYGSDELKAQYMDKFQDKTVFTCFALTEQSGGTRRHPHDGREGRERRLHPQRREVADLPHRLLRVRVRHRRDRPGEAGRRAPVRLLRAVRHPRLRDHPDAPHDGRSRRGPHRPQVHEHEA